MPYKLHGSPVAAARCPPSRAWCGRATISFEGSFASEGSHDSLEERERGCGRGGRDLADCSPRVARGVDAERHGDGEGHGRDHDVANGHRAAPRARVTLLLKLREDVGLTEAAERERPKAVLDGRREITKIAAPIDGYVTKEAVATGDYLQVGQALMSLVPPRVWVTANFKETQLRNMRPGQPVDISVDAYPSLKLRGRVDSIQAGSGAAFSLLPPENATGNYVKVVQRVPVKIVLEERQELQRVLGPGMSVVPTVAVDHGTEGAFVIALIAIVLAAGVILGAALWIGRVKKEQA